jgi:hypothetical protein
MKSVLLVLALFTLSFTAYGSDSNQPPTPALGSETSTTIHDKGSEPELPVLAPSAVSPADKILAEQAEINTRMVNDTLRGTLSPPDKLRAATNADALVSNWLEEHAAHAEAIVDSKSPNRGSKAHSHVHYQDIEMEAGSGWCDLCGCWMRHGSDPNGTPQSEIGHQNVCTGGADTLNCWMHYYRYCFSS